MSTLDTRLGRAETILQDEGGDGEDLDVVVVYERSVRGPDDVLVQVPVDIPFPEGYEVTFEETQADGSKYRVWKPRPEASHGVLACEETK